MGCKGYFDAVADNWDTLRAGFFSEAVRDAACARAPLAPGQMAADVGA
ncbi:methyltransferase type 11, partial [Desulfovibrio sp. XJ01]|nr:methyltransferase type 11 [Nitratidesulfovibrio liaohensis]